MLSTNVAAAYADLARLYSERDVAERAMAVQGETAKLVQSRVANGLDTLGDQRQAEANPLQAKADLGAIDEQIALTRNRLAALAGDGPDRGIGLARPSATALKSLGVPAELAANLVGRRPDVTAARWRAEAAAQHIHEARASFFPDVNLTAFIGTDALHLNKVFGTGSDVGSVGPAVSLPIFDAGRLRAGLRGAEADRDAAVASYDGAVTEAFRQGLLTSWLPAVRFNRSSPTRAQHWWPAKTPIGLQSSAIRVVFPPIRRSCSPSRVCCNAVVSSPTWTPAGSLLTSSWSARSAAGFIRPDRPSPLPRRKFSSKDRSDV